MTTAQHAILQDGVLVEYQGRFAVDNEGIQYPLKPMTPAEKLAFGIYEITDSNIVPTGHRKIGTELVLEGETVIRRPVAEPLEPGELIFAIKTEASRRIVAFCPEWKQRNLTAQAAILAKKGEASWTPEEAAAWAAGEAVWTYIAQVRAASDALEASDPPVYDYDSDEHWPTPPAG